MAQTMHIVFMDTGGFMRIILGLLILISISACGKHDGSEKRGFGGGPMTNLGYACDFVQRPAYLVAQYSCQQPATGEVCTVMANEETGDRISSDCAEYQ
jgi:hypothetical protein